MSCMTRLLDLRGQDWRRSRRHKVRVLRPGHLGLWKRERYTQTAVGFSWPLAARALWFRRSSLTQVLPWVERTLSKGVEVG